MRAKQIFLSVAILAFVKICLISSAAHSAQEQYRNAVLGFSLRKPADWDFVVAEDIQESLNRLDFSDPALKALLLRYAASPFVALIKHNEPPDHLDPSIRINVREAGSMKNMPPDKLIATYSDVMSATLSQIFKDYRLVDGPTATAISGKPAGYFRIEYTYELDGQTSPGTSEVWVVLSGDLLFTIGAATRRDERSGTRAEVRRIIDTIQID